MRVKDRQKRANEAFTKPLTTHLTRGKGDFSCRGWNGESKVLLPKDTTQCQVPGKGSNRANHEATAKPSQFEHTQENHKNKKNLPPRTPY